MKITDLIKSNTPFAVVQFFEWVKLMPDEKMKFYDLLVKDSDGKIATHRLNGSQVRYFKQNISMFNLYQKDKHGSVYEFLEFKKSLKSIGIFSMVEQEKKEGSVFFD